MCPPVTPPKHGEVRNPTGRNQYTYRADAEKHLAEWCKVYGRELIEKLLDDAKKGKGYAMKLALDRILPAVQQHEVALTDTDDESLVTQLAAIARAKRGNGHDPDPLATGEEEPQ